MGFAPPQHGIYTSNSLTNHLSRMAICCFVQNRPPYLFEEAIGETDWIFIVFKKFQAISWKFSFAPCVYLYVLILVSCFWNISVWVFCFKGVDLHPIVLGWSFARLVPFPVARFATLVADMGISQRAYSPFSWETSTSYITHGIYDAVQIISLMTSALQTTHLSKLASMSSYEGLL